MDRISVDFDSLPKSIKRRELARLVDEYRNTQNEDARNRLIEVNLRMCWEFVYNYCEKIKCLDMFDELYAESIIALSQAIDDFDDEKCESFLLYAKKCILSHISTIYMNHQNDALSHISTELNNEALDNMTNESLFLIKEDVLSQDFIDDVKNYLSKFSFKEQKIVKMYLGLDCDRRYSRSEISKSLNVSLSEIYAVTKKVCERLEGFVKRKYLSDCSEYLESREMAKLECSKKDIFYWYYAQCFNISEIAKMYRTEEKYIKKIILEYRKNYEKEEFVDLLENKIKKLFENNYFFERSMKKIFQEYYGVGENDCLTINEIEFVNRLSSRGIVSSIIQDCKKLFTKGDLLEEDFAILDEKREDYFRLSEYVYNSLYGENDCEQKSLQQLSFELKMPVSDLDKRIKQYKCSKNEILII